MNYYQLTDSESHDLQTYCLLHPHNCCRKREGDRGRETIVVVSLFVSSIHLSSTDRNLMRKRF